MPTGTFRHAQPALLCTLLLLLGSHALAGVGRTPGDVAVSDSGTGSYSIPLSLPPGTNSLAPSLAVTYDHAAGNGLLGMGWRIDGFSAITRCSNTVAQDGVLTAITLSTADRFCLDGNKLRWTGGSAYGLAGSIYQTEIETFSRVTANATAGTGPASFTVERKDGLVYEYGHTTDSRIEGAGGSTVREWALNRIRDRSGNYVDFVYTDDTANGSYRPNEIRWTGNTSGTPTIFRARFVYEVADRPDPLVRYFVGQKVKETKRLERIEIDHSGTVVRKYVISYGSAGATGRSRVSQVQECGSSDCLSASTVVWRSYSAGWGSESTSVVASTFASALAGDTNGDGREDLAWFDLSQGKWVVQFGNASGGLDNPLSTTFGNALYYNRALPADVDGDGKRDILVPDGTNWFWLRHTSGSTFAYTNTNTAATGSNGDAWTLDADGDGRDDLIWAERNSGIQTIRIRLNTTTGGVASFSTTAAAAWNTESQFEKFADSAPFGSVSLYFRHNSRIVDANGDGRSDLLVSLKYDESEGEPPPGPSWIYYWKVLLGTGSEFILGDTITNLGTVFTPYPADLNGDGLTDVAYYKGSAWKIRFASGSGWFAPEFNTAQGSAGFANPLFTDFDCDGRTDILVPGTNPGTTNWLYLRSTGESLQAAADTGMVSTGATFSPKVADLNGDGLQDLIYSASTSDSTRLRTHNGPPPDLLQTLTDGFGNFVTFTYAPLTDPAVYTKLSGSAWPVREYQGPFQVVQQYAASTGAVSPEPTSYTVSFKYEGSRIHAQGRGPLGFAKRTTTDSRTGVFTEETYKQEIADYEAIGMPSKITAKRSASGNKIVETTLTWQRNTYNGGTYNERRFPFPSQNETKSYEVDGPSDGVLISTATTTSLYDVWGNPTDVTEVLTENATGLYPGATHTRRTYHQSMINDSPTWCLGKPTTTQWINSHTLLPGGTQITRVKNLDWNLSQCRLIQEVLAPSSALQVTTDYFYDGFGNVNQIVVTPAVGSGQATRSTTASWGTDGRFPRSVTNAEGHVQQFTWDIDAGPTRFGSLRTITDPNTLVTTLEHDDFGRPKKQIRPDGTAVQWDYVDCASDCTGIAGAHHKTIRTVKNNASEAMISESFVVHDALGREVRSTNYQLEGGKSDVLTVFAGPGWVAKRSQPHFNGIGVPEWTTFTYDQVGRIKQESRAKTNDYDASAYVSSTSYEGLTTRLARSRCAITTRCDRSSRSFRPTGLSIKPSRRTRSTLSVTC